MPCPKKLVWSDLGPEKDEKGLKIFVQEACEQVGWGESSLAYSLKKGLMPKHPQKVTSALKFHNFYAASCQDN